MGGEHMGAERLDGERMAMNDIVARIVAEWPARQADAPYTPTGHDLALLSDAVAPDRRLTRAEIAEFVVAVRKELGQ